MPSNLRRRLVSTLGRPIDPSVPTNLAVLLLTLAALVAGLAVALVRNATVGAALLEGLSWAGSLFLAWALARETDPDRSGSAFFAGAGGFAGAVLLGPPGFLLLFWLLIGLRYINQSTGLPPGALDFAALYGIKLWLGISAHWTIPLLTFPTVLFADLKRFPVPLRIGLPLVLPVVGVTLGFVRGWRVEAPAWGTVEFVVLAAIAVAILPVIAGYRRVRSVGDRTGEPLSPHRVRWALAWSVGTAIILTATGTSSVQELAPLWAALAGTAIGGCTEILICRLRS